MSSPVSRDVFTFPTILFFAKAAKFITISAGFDVDQLTGGKAIWLMKTLKTTSV
jgi:hypothetical protein